MKLREQIARIVDPASWRVMDSYLKQAKREYKGQHVGWPEDQFWDKDSLAKADAILALLGERIAELERERDNLIISIDEHVTVRGEYLARAETAAARVKALEEVLNPLAHSYKAMITAHECPNHADVYYGLWKGNREHWERLAALSQSGKG